MQAHGRSVALRHTARDVVPRGVFLVAVGIRFAFLDLTFSQHILFDHITAKRTSSGKSCRHWFFASNSASQHYINIFGLGLRQTARSACWWPSHYIWARLAPSRVGTTQVVLLAPLRIAPEMTSACCCSWSSISVDRRCGDLLESAVS